MVNSYTNDRSEMASVSISYPIFPSVRLFMVFLSFCGIMAINCSFAAFNFGIVCMVKFNSTEHIQPSQHSGEFDWDKVQQSNLLAAYAVGAVITSIPGGWLSDKYGGKFVFLACLLINLIGTALSPWAAYRGLAWFFGARVLCGMASGAGWTCVIGIVSRWARPNEKATLMGFSLSGVLVGQLITLPVSGVLCQSVPGWPSIFYTWAGLSGLVSLLWLVLYTDNPKKCRFISQLELEYLLADPNCNSNKTSIRLPLRNVLFSTASLAIYACHFCNAWMGTFMNEFAPTYCKEVLNLDVQTNGFYSALPLLSQVVSYWIFGLLADRITLPSMSITFSVKLFNTICMGLPIVGLLVLAFLDKSSGVWAAILSLCFCTFFYASCVAGFVRCMVLIAPKCAGTISAVSNFWSYVGCIIMPYITGIITNDGTASEWHIAFYIGVAISAFGCLEFLIFGSGQEQHWAKNDSNDYTSTSDKSDTVILKF